MTAIRTSRGEAARRRLAELQVRAARKSLRHCVKWLWPIKNGTGTSPVWGWHLDAMSEAMQAFVLGDVRKLVINVPPGVGKSSIASRTAALWAWVQDEIDGVPGASQRFLYMAHKVKLATKLQDDRIRALMHHRYGAMRPRRPDGRLAWTLEKVGSELVTNSEGGQMEPFSWGQSPTGDHYDRHIYDDPHGISDTALEVSKSVSWVMDTASTRFRDEASMAFALIMQRVSTADATAAMLEEHPDAVHLCLPMEYDPRRICDLRPHGIDFVDPRSKVGESLPAHGKTPEVIARHKRDPRKWATQYQQSPVAGSGNVFDSRWWLRWREVDTSAQFVGVIDATMGSKGRRASYLCIAVWALQTVRGQTSARVVDVLRMTAGWTETEAAALFMVRRWPRCRRWLVEEKKFGKALLDLLAKRGVPVVNVKPEGGGDKEQRAAAVVPFVREGLCYIPALDAHRPPQLAPARRLRDLRDVPPALRAVADAIDEGDHHKARQALIRHLPPESDRRARAVWDEFAGYLAGAWGPPGWLVDWMDEHKAFPNAGNDDQVDTTTMVLSDHSHAFGRRLSASQAGKGVTREASAKGAPRVIEGPRPARF